MVMMIVGKSQVGERMVCCEIGWSGVGNEGGEVWESKEEVC